MKDAIGGLFSIQVIIIFLVIINSYLAFSVNYTKAFRVKNQIISLIEQYEGLEQARPQINAYINKVHYRVPNDYTNKCINEGLVAQAGGYCIATTPVGAQGSVNGTEKYIGSYYTVVTYINIDVPILNKIFPVFANAFRIKGETKLIYKSGNNSETVS